MKYSIILKIVFIHLLTFVYINAESQISNIIPDYGFGYEENYVTTAWKNSGAFPVNYGNLQIDEWIDVTKSSFDIHTGYDPVGQKIQNLIDSYNNFTGQVLIYFPPGQYTIETSLTIRSNIILKGAGGGMFDINTTKFWMEVESGNSINFTSDAYRSGIEDIYLVDYQISDDFSNTIYIPRGASHCWVRGVESYKTRRFHVNIYGHNITVSGCYFRHSWDYGTGGRGYGVCLSGSLDHDYGAYSCRVEDNIFHDLRHSMVFQFNPGLNVVAYNFSDAPRDNWGYNDNSADLLFHGNKGENQFEHIGPYWNLAEGNICTYIRFDEYNKQNGPFNTIFRCKATHKSKIDLISGVTNQYKQNFVGCDSDPTSSTQNKVDEYGFSQYWEESPDWSNIPSSSCSYYKQSKPDFWDSQISWLQWPFLASELNPAKYRYDRNNGYYQSDPPTTEVVNAGWDIYPNMCGPPYINFSDSPILDNVDEEFLAMNEIETNGSYVINSNNNIIFKAEERIILKPGFKVTPNNNYFYASSGDICSNNKSLVPFKTPEDELEIVKIPYNYDPYNCTKSNQEFEKSEIATNLPSINLGPNPNNGIFSIFLPANIELPIKVYLTDINGNLVLYKKILTWEDLTINIRTKPQGVYFLKLITENDIHHKKIVYSI